MMQSVTKDGNSVFRLPEKLNAAAAQELLATIRSHQGHALRIDAADVTMLGTQCLQILVAAHQHWTSEGTKFEVRGLSDEITRVFGALGLTLQQIGAREV